METLTLMFALDVDQALLFQHFTYDDEGKFKFSNVLNSVRVTFKTEPYHDVAIESISVYHDEITNNISLKVEVSSMFKLEEIMRKTKGQFKLELNKALRSTQLQLSIKQV